MPKIAKSDVHYRKADDLERSCGTCWKFRGPPIVPPTQRPSGFCLKIAGVIYSDDTCDRWALDRASDPYLTKQDARSGKYIELGVGNPHQMPNAALREGKVRVYVFNSNGDLLGLRRDAARHRGGQWEMVQGTIDDGETPDDAALREFREETGYALTDVEDFTQLSGRTYAVSLKPRVGNPKIEDNVELEHDAWYFGKPEVMLAWFGRVDLTKAASDDVERILRAIAWDDWDALTRMVAPGIGEAASDGVLQGVAELGIDDDEVFSLANADAIEYASERSADLITSVTDATRNGVRRLIEQALTDGWTPAQLADTLGASRLFSPERAETIARTELAMANTQGNLAVWRRSGLVMGKQWLMSNVHDQDDVCDENAAAGVIPLDADFPSGDDGPPAHPSCQCTIVPVLMQEAA